MNISTEKNDHYQIDTNGGGGGGWLVGWLVSGTLFGFSLSLVILKPKPEKKIIFVYLASHM